MLSPSSPISAAALYTNDSTVSGPAGPATRRTEPAWNRRVTRPLGDRRGDRRVGDVERVVPHEDVKSGRVAPANLHAVDRRQRLLDRQVAGPRRRRRVATGEGVDLVGRAQTIAADRPQHVAETDRRRAGPFQRVGVEHRRRRAGLDLLGIAVELVEASADRGDELVAVGEGEHARQAAQRGVDLGCGIGDCGRVTDEGQRPVQAVDEVGRLAAWPASAAG